MIDASLTRREREIMTVSISLAEPMPNKLERLFPMPRAVQPSGRFCGFLKGRARFNTLKNTCATSTNRRCLPVSLTDMRWSIWWKPSLKALVIRLFLPCSITSHWD